jgi:hypothetical protein
MREGTSNSSHNGSTPSGKCKLQTSNTENGKCSMKLPKNEFRVQNNKPVKIPFSMCDQIKTASVPHFESQQGVCHTVALPFTLKSILRQKKNYGNSNTSPCKNIIFQKSS